ncbi:DUF4232 domain-containing protein [Streptomyces sp. NPDC046985]|uniref:DUF4232 domain-containing protein n=1 Tax=Streptomyces sp. NPDC046985 TaxID=3155377 RepID=UPI0033E68671
MHAKKIRPGMAALTIVAAGCVLLACGTTDHSSAASASPDKAEASSASSHAATPETGGGTTAAATDDAASATTAGKTESAGAETEHACSSDDLKVTATAGDSGGGNTGERLVFMNTGKDTCTLKGFPGVSFVKSHNVQLGKSAKRVGGSPAEVAYLIPNGHAYADVQMINGMGGYSASQCDLTKVPTLRVYPPGQKESFNIPFGKSECVGSDVQNLRVGPVYRDR